MNKFLKIATIGMAVIFFSNGCASYLVYKNSEQKIVERKAMAMGNNAAIKAVALPNGGAGIGIDVSNWEALSEQPLMQLGAAIIDAGTLYGSYKGVKSITGGNSKSSTTTPPPVVNGNGNTVTIVNGSGNSGVGNPDYSETGMQ